LERENKKNAESLARIFGLTKAEGDVLNQMRGMLKDYSDERTTLMKG